MMQQHNLGDAVRDAITGGTRVTGVFGYPVGHSLSPAMHNAAFAALGINYVYVPFEVHPDSIGAAIRSLPALGIVGVNLTIPHKVSVIPFLDELTPEAATIGAVNTVHCVDGRLLGDNTDGRGFFRPLAELEANWRGRRALVLGAGGAARAVVFELARQGVQVTLTNRTVERAQILAAEVCTTWPDCGIIVLPMDGVAEMARAVQEADLLVNTTRVGMYPEADAMPPVPIGALHPGLLVYDLVYNPPATRLLQAAREAGSRTMTGVKMLVYQGAAAFERWTGIWPPVDVMEAAVLRGREIDRLQLARQ